MRESRRKADAGTRDCGCLTERGETHTRKKKQNGIVCLSNQTWSSNDERQHVGIVALSNK